MLFRLRAHAGSPPPRRFRSAHGRKCPRTGHRGGNALRIVAALNIRHADADRPITGRHAMNIDDVVNIEDLHQLAKRRLPKIAFDFIEGGRRGRARARNATRRRFTSTGCCRAISSTCRSATRPRRFSASTFSSPFGISPTGGAGLFRRGADLMLAEAARDANIPYIMSGGSNDSMEAAAKVAPDNHLISALRRARRRDHRRPGPARRRCRARRAGADRRRAGAAEARAQHAQRLCQYSRRRLSSRR